jgi:hypothetical protein
MSIEDVFEQGPEENIWPESKGKRHGEDLHIRDFFSDVI